MPPAEAGTARRGRLKPGRAASARPTSNSSRSCSPSAARGGHARRPGRLSQPVGQPRCPAARAAGPARRAAVFLQRRRHAGVPAGAGPSRKPARSRRPSSRRGPARSRRRPCAHRFPGPRVRPDRPAGAGNRRDGRRRSTTPSWPPGWPSPASPLLFLVVYRGFALPAADRRHAAGRHGLGDGLADADGRPPEHPVGDVRGHAHRHGRLRRAVGDALRAGPRATGMDVRRPCCTRRRTWPSAT